MDSSAATVSLKGASTAPVASVDASKHLLTFDLDDQPHGADLDIRTSN